MVDFYRHLSWRKFDSFVEQFELNSRSWLRWAQANDVDRYEAAAKAGTLTKGTPRIETFEWGQTEQLLSATVELLQQVIHVTAQKGAKHPKKFKSRPWPTPATAMDELKKRAQAAVAQKRKAFMGMFEFVPQDQWEAEMAEHRAHVETAKEPPFDP